MASIPIGQTIGASFDRVLGYTKEAFTVGLPYYVALIVLGLIAVFVVLPLLDSTGGIILGLGFFLINMAIYSAMLVAWHRVTLLGYGADKGLFRIGLNGRTWRFLGYSLLVYPLAILLFVVWYLASELGTAAELVVGLACVAVAIFLMVRFCLVLPATAADHPASLKMSWQQTSGHFWPMLAVFAVLFVIALVAALVIGGILNLLLGWLGLIGVILIQLALVPVQLLGILVFVSALSYVYRILSGHPDPLVHTP